MADKTIAFNVLIVVMILVYDFLVDLWRESGRPIFLAGILGLSMLPTLGYLILNATNIFAIETFPTHSKFVLWSRRLRNTD